MWGRMNNDWYMCTKGKNQSPIDIEPNILLFDPSLKHIVIDGDRVSDLITHLVNAQFHSYLEIKHYEASANSYPE